MNPNPATDEQKREPCPDCGSYAEDFMEGVCEHCWRYNQRALDAHLSIIDHWNSMTDKQREQAIKDAP